MKNTPGTPSTMPIERSVRRRHARMGALVGALAGLSALALWPLTDEAVRPRPTAASVQRSTTNRAAAGHVARSEPGTDRTGTHGHANTSAAIGGSPALPDGVELGDVMRRVHFAFRPDGPGFEGGHTTYDVRERFGSVTLRHRRQPSREAARDADARREEGARGQATERGAIEASALELRTRTFERDGRSMLGDNVESRVGSTGQLEIDRGHVVEEWTNREDGTEQTWRVAGRPAGEGDLVVEVATSGLDFVGSTDTGLHFADDSGLGFRYGHATWVDALGIRTPVNATFDAGRIVLRVPAAVVDASAYPAVLDPSVGPEFGVDDPVPSPSIGNRDHPSVAFDGTNYLVVWHSGNAVCAARVTTAGVVLDPMGIVVSRSPLGDADPEVVFDGTNYFIVWMDGRNGIFFGIYGARVSTAGTVLDPGGIAIHASIDRAVSPAVAFDGTNHLVVWTDNRAGTYHVYGARVSIDGTVLEPGGFLVSKASYEQGSPALAFDGTNYLVVWEEARASSHDLYGTRVSVSGAVLDPSEILVSAAINGQREPSVASDGTQFLVVWRDLRPDTWSDIYAARLASDGSLLDPSGVVVSAAAQIQQAPAVAYDGTGFFVVWDDLRSSNFQIYGARITAGATVLDADGILLDDAAHSHQTPALAFDGSNFLVVAEDTTGGHSQISGMRVTPAGSMVDSPPFVISKGPNAEHAPSVAFDGTNYLVVWEDLRRFPQKDVYGARISGAGAVLDPNGIAVSGASGGAVPAVDFDGTNFLVVWQAGDDIHGARVTGSGTLLDPAGFAVSAANGCQMDPSLAFDGTNHLVVWSDLRSTGAFYGARVTPEGSVLDPSGILIHSVPGSPLGAPAVSFGGTTYLVVWDVYESGNKVYGARVTPAGVVLDPSPFHFGQVGTGTQYGPALAFDGTNFLVVWRDSRGDGGADVYGARFAPSGTILDGTGFPVAAAPGFQGIPAVAFDGTNFLVVWEDGRNGASSDIRGSRVSTAGSTLDAGGFAVAVSTGRSHLAPAMASNGAGGGLVVYEAPVASAQNATRVVARLLFCAASDATCDGLDDDCDGAVDDDYVSLATVCGIGPCASTGATSCSGGIVADSCMPIPGASSDATCDGLDEDCDGTADEDGSCGPTDAAIVDAALVDAALVDASTDASAEADASVPWQGGSVHGGACTCGVAGQSSNRSTPAAWLVIVGLVVARSSSRDRRERHGTSRRSA